MIYIFWSCKDEVEAKNIIHTLLNQKLIACASIFPVESIYRWEGKIDEDKEIKVILKTDSKHFKEINTYIQDNCSYDVPEIVQVDVANGNPEYLKWVNESVK